MSVEEVTISRSNLKLALPVFMRLQLPGDFLPCEHFLLLTFMSVGEHLGVSLVCSVLLKEEIFYI